MKNITPNKPIHIIPNGMGAELFKPLDQKIARKSLGLDTGYHLLLLQGSLDVWVDIEDNKSRKSRLRKHLT